MKTLNPIKFIVLLIGSLTLPTEALRAQTVIWTSSHPDIVSVDENGTIEMISEPLETANVTITATVEQNGKTVTSSKIVQTDDCITCFTFNSLTYCGVRLSNGQCWTDRNIGAASTAEHGSMFDSVASAVSACPTGWRLATPAEFLEVVRLKTGNSSIAYTTSRNTITVEIMAAAPLIFQPSSDNCPHLRVQGAYFNWGAACPQSAPLYRTSYFNYDMGVRCIKQ